MSSIASIKNLPVPAVQKRLAADAQPEKTVAPVKPVAAIAKILRPREDARDKLPELHADEGKSGRRSPARLDSADTRSNESVAEESGRSSVQFLVQVLGQQAASPKSSRHSAGPIDLAEHRDGAALGSEIYRRAGGEPHSFSSDATIFRIAV